MAAANHAGGATREPGALRRFYSDPSAHQLYNQYPPKKFYDINVKAVMQQFHPDLPASVLFGYNGNVPGPRATPTMASRY